jgi:PAS domain S-box-containing protein
MNARFELYQLVTPLAGLGIWERNLVTGAFFWNSIIYQLLEVPPDYEAALEESLNFYKDKKQIRDLFEKAAKTGQPQTCEAEILTAKGNNRWLKVRVAALMEDGKCVQLYGTLEDITQEVTMRNLLQEREQRFGQAFSHAPIGMALVSLKGAWIKVNRSLCDMMGYTEEEFLHHTFQQFTYPDDLESDLTQLKQLLAGEISTYSMEKRYFHRKGHLIWALLNVSLVRDENGEPLYFVSQIKDITDSKKSAEIIGNQNSRLLNFAHIVSHNLRSHAGNIQMLAQMVMNEPDCEEQTHMLEMLDDNARTLLETLSHLNEVVNIQHHNAKNLKELNLKREIKRVTDVLSPSIKEVSGTIDVDIDPDIFINYDPAYLESILINLVSNTVKYRDTERPLRVEVTTEINNQTLQLKVSDNGLGLDMQKYGHRLFGMYERFHNHPDSRGVGLFLVKSQVEAMGGHISVSSELNEGTTFTVTIPNFQIVQRPLLYALKTA